MDLSRLEDGPPGEGAAARGESVRAWLLRAIRTEPERLDREPPDDRLPSEDRPPAARREGGGG